MDRRQQDELQRAAFAKKVYERVQELEEEKRRERRAYYERLRAEALPRDRDLIDRMYRAGEAGVFSNHHGFGHLGCEPALGRPGPFVLNPGNTPGYEASEFFTWWRRENPAAVPTGEIRQKCLDDALAAARSHPSFPQGEFVRAVHELFNHWSCSTAMGRY